MAASRPMTLKQKIRQFKIELEEIRNDCLDAQSELVLECRRALNQKGCVWARVAREAGVGPETIKRFAEGTTTYPRFLTVLGILRACGYTITITEPSAAGVQKLVAQAAPFERKVQEARERLGIYAKPKVVEPKRLHS